MDAPETVCVDSSMLRGRTGARRSSHGAAAAVAAGYNPKIVSSLAKLPVHAPKKKRRPAGYTTLPYPTLPQSSLPASPLITVTYFDFDFNLPRRH